MRRFTPTPVGNTGPSFRSSGHSSVHPHACGEYGAGAAGAVSIAGSPPRLWGIRRGFLRCGGAGRFTPTPVGNTMLRCAPGTAWPVHPHACGEYMEQEALLILQDGSPPRLWGIPQGLSIPGARLRFTPTPVGNTFLTPRPTSASAVHPHACGEYPGHSTSSGSPTGSPPRLWGIHDDTLLQQFHPRFTPTPVGNTHRSAAHADHRAVHPHACGEYPIVDAIAPGGDGSPPRLWGIRRHDMSQSSPQRFTPTPVGNTTMATKIRRAVAVHPHACGEYPLLSFMPEAMRGSPPRLWGIRCRPRRTTGR